MHAIIETGGKQYKVAEGDTLFIEKLPNEAGDNVTFDKVLAVIDGEKITVKLEDVEAEAAKQLALVQQQMYDKAKKNLEENIYPAYSLEEAKQLQKEHGGFIKTMWCGDEACEIKMKEEAGMSSRCMPLTQEHLGDVCPICGKPAKTMIYWGVAY